MSITAFSSSSLKRVSRLGTTDQALPFQCSVSAACAKFLAAQQDEPTAHASVVELARTLVRTLSPTGGFGLGTTVKLAPAVVGAANATVAATSTARTRTLNDIGHLPTVPTHGGARRFERLRERHAGLQQRAREAECRVRHEDVGAHRAAAEPALRHRRPLRLL